MKSFIQNISIIGSGNVATHITVALHKAGFNICEIYSSTLKNATLLANKVNATALKNIEDMSPNADLYLFSVSDKAYTRILSRFPFNNKLLAHTAGSLSMEMLQAKSNNYGVLYPFQTLSKTKEIAFKDVPLLYCASNSESEALLKILAEKLSSNVSYANDEQRKYIHISAVFACNFVNHMYAIAQSITKAHNIDFALLYPLIKETAEKALLNNPEDVQTGPAVRKDQNIIDSHIELLKNNTELQDIYTLLSNNIIKHPTKNGEEF